jgi:hypothetical protein
MLILSFRVKPLATDAFYCRINYIVFPVYDRARVFHGPPKMKMITEDYSVINLMCTDEPVSIDA